MQANRSLSPSQFATLQTVLAFLEGVTTHLDTENRTTSEVDIELTRAVRDLGRLCISKMLTDFPDLAVWRSIGRADDAWALQDLHPLGETE
jgi:hypothetical protein